MKKILFVLCICLCLSGCSSIIQKVEIYEPLTVYQNTRESLSSEHKVAYDQIINTYLNMDTRVKLFHMDIDTLEILIQAVLNDHPEIYYLNNQYTYETVNDDDNDYFIYCPQYRFTDDEIIEMNTSIDNIVQPIITEVSTKDNDYEKVKYVYDYIIDHCVYDEQSKENQNVLSVFLYQRSVCAGYAKSMQYILQKLNIQCAYITGYPRYQSTQAHAWNMVNMDGDWYYLDATNGDPNEETLSPEFRYLYFGLTKQQMLRLYEPDNDAYIKEASSLKDNYFYRKNAYFQSFDIGQLQEIIDQNQTTLQPFSLTLLCSDSDIGRSINDYLQTDPYFFEVTNAQQFQYYEIPELNAYVYLPQ